MVGTGCSGAKERFIPDIVQNCQPAVITEQANSESLLLLGLNSLQMRHTFNACTQGPPLGMSLLWGPHPAFTPLSIKQRKRGAAISSPPLKGGLM